MCVIYVCTHNLPPTEELERGAFQNDDGAGLCWLGPTINEKTKKPNNDLTVHWRKDFKSEKDILEFIQKDKIPFPLMIHFRTASVGSAIPELAHPFPVVEDAPLWTAGHAPEVLMHNGHVGNWEDLVMNIGFKSQEKFPTGEWSDSRALAWITYIKGHGVLDFIIKSSRVAVMYADPDTLGTPSYDRAEDHIAVYGPGWIHKAGYSQSITTEWGGNKGGRFTDTRRDFRPDTHTGVSKDAGPVCGVPKREEPTEDPTDKTYPDNIWAISELKNLLSTIEEHQKNARVATGR